MAFYAVYIEEAHPSDIWQMGSNVRDGVVFRNPQTGGAVLELHVRLSPVDRVLVQLPNRGDVAPAIGDDVEIGWQRDAGMVFAERQNRVEDGP